MIYNGKNLNYKIAGSGDVVVLLHGFMESSNIWLDFGYELARNFLCIAPDLPSHGKSDMLAEIHSMELIAETVKVILDENQVKRCVLAGHSMGGYVALAFSEKYPEMMQGLVLFHSTSLAETEEGKRNRERAIELIYIRYSIAPISQIWMYRRYNVAFYILVQMYIKVYT